MKLTLILALATSLVAAQSPDDLRPCAKPCVTKSMTSGAGGCKLGDVNCFCSNKNFLDDIACCLVDVCSKEDQEKTISYAKEICGAVKATVPDKVECKKNAVASGSSASSSSSTSSATGTAAAAAKSSAAAAPMLGGAGGLAGALMAIAAAL